MKTFAFFSMIYSSVLPLHHFPGLRSSKYACCAKMAHLEMIQLSCTYVYKVCISFQIMCNLPDLGVVKNHTPQDYFTCRCAMVCYMYALLQNVSHLLAAKDKAWLCDLSLNTSEGSDCNRQRLYQCTEKLYCLNKDTGVVVIHWAWGARGPASIPRAPSLFYFILFFFFNFFIFWIYFFGFTIPAKSVFFFFFFGSPSPQNSPTWVNMN